MKYNNLLSGGYFSDTAHILEHRQQTEMKVKGLWEFKTELVIHSLIIC